MTFAATGAISRDMIQSTRGWTDEDWAQSVRRLRARGLLDAGGRLTKTGGALRRDVEDLTDRLAAGPSSGWALPESSGPSSSPPRSATT